LAVHEAIQATAAFLQGEAREVPGFHFPVAPIAIAGLALKAHTVFLNGNAEHGTPAELARAVVDAARGF
jgi:CBS-domain-containing membrane protein